MQRTSLETNKTGTLTTRRGTVLLCTCNTEKVSSVIDLYAVLEAADRIKSLVISIRETKRRNCDIRQLDERTIVIVGGKTPLRNVGGVGFVVHLGIS
uniref:MTTase N-terminal domain-containing protein n=1 Tax=Angiostrongylus cantonensis TaxID=6313 RepID=A0A0K0DNX5_ANGCA